MARVTRRRFLATAAAGAAVAPHVWVKSAAAQPKQLSVLTWSHFVPAYDKWFDQWGQEWAGKHNVKLTIDHIPHLNIPAKIAAEVATQSGHDIVQMPGTGTEKFAPSLVDVQDLADKLGKTITYNSKEVREALKYFKALYKEAMTPEVLAWDDASNNRLLASGRGSWIHNPISAYRTIEGQNKELADKIFIQLSPRGPAGRLSYANCLAYGITKFSPNQ